MLVTCKVIKGHGEKLLVFEYTLEVKPIWFVDRSDVACERGAKGDLV